MLVVLNSVEETTPENKTEPIYNTPEEVITFLNLVMQVTKL